MNCAPRQKILLSAKNAVAIISSLDIVVVIPDIVMFIVSIVAVGGGSRSGRELKG